MCRCIGSHQGIASRGTSFACYICGTYNKSKDKCASHYIDAGTVRDEVLRVLHEHMAAYTDSVEMERRQERKNPITEKNNAIFGEISRIQMELRKLDARKPQLYEDYARQLIDAEQYREIRDQDAHKEKDGKEQLRRLDGERRNP